MNEWISVKDRLPKPNENVLVYCEEYGVDVDYLTSNGIFWYNEDDVTHWMPMPEPPDKQTTEGAE